MLTSKEAASRQGDASIGDANGIQLIHDEESPCTMLDGTRRMPQDEQCTNDSDSDDLFVFQDEGEDEYDDFGSILFSFDDDDLEEVEEHGEIHQSKSIANASLAEVSTTPNQCYDDIMGHPPAHEDMELSDLEVATLEFFPCVTTWVHDMVSSMSCSQDCIISKRSTLTYQKQREERHL